MELINFQKQLNCLSKPYGEKSIRIMDNLIAYAIIHLHVRYLNRTIKAVQGLLW
jgi:hypothetical protein